MSKHTPAPWESVTKHNHGTFIYGKDDRAPVEFCCIAEIGMNYDFGESNAQLISAAPDLLEALIRLLPMAEDDALQYGGKPDCDDDITFARAAIAKATGESP